MLTKVKISARMLKVLNERRAKQNGNEKERAKAREKETEVSAGEKRKRKETEAKRTSGRKEVGKETGKRKLKTAEKKMKILQKGIDKSERVW